MAETKNLFNTEQKIYGATHSEWMAAKKALGYQHLLPSVHTPAAILPRSPVSEAAKASGGDLSKIPSHVNGGFATGLAEWQNRTVSQAIVRTWSQNKHYGICLRLGKPWHAIDIDLDDEAAIEAALNIIKAALPGIDFPTRQRANSTRKTLLVGIDTPQKKEKVTVAAADKAAGRKAQMIEFLGDGQHSIIGGTHSSGARIEWAAGELTKPPMITAEQWQAVIEALRNHFDPEGELNTPKKTAPIRTQYAEYKPSKDTTRYGSIALSGACNAIANAPEGERNPTLFKQAAKAFELVAGGEVSEADADLAIFSAAQAAGLDDNEIETTMASAKKAGFKQPRTAPPRVALADDFERFEPIPESPQVKANKAAAAPEKPASPVSFGLPGGEAGSKYVDPGYIALPDVGSKGRILSTERNLRTVMKAHGVRVGYDVVRKEVDIFVPGLRVHPDEQQNAALTAIEDFAIRAGMTGTKIPQQVLSAAVKNPVNPFMNWVNSAPWDGVDRIAPLSGTLKSSSSEMQELLSILLRRWLLSVVASQVKTGFWSKGVLTLQGAQNAGKTSWFRRLFSGVPSVFADGITLAIGNKDSLMEVLSYVAVELGELGGTFKKSEINDLKAFISRQKDKLRRPYAAGQSHWSRRTVFCATVNDEQFLADDTGNSRFWAVSVESIDFNHRIDMQQVWAQCLQLVNDGETWHLTREEEARLNESNKQFEPADAIDEMLRVRFDPTRAGRTYTRTISQVLREICNINTPTRSQQIKAAGTLKALGFKPRSSNGANVYDLPQPWEAYEPPLVE